MLPQFEKLISLEEELADSASPPFVQLHLTGKDINEEISRLKTASSTRFREKWEKILEKYSAIDDNLESDEIDLETGKITIDNGHLRSMVANEIVVGGVTVNGDIWAEDDSFDKAYNDQRRVRAHQERLRERFENHIRRHKDGSPLKLGAVPDDNLHHAFSGSLKRNISGVSLGNNSPMEFSASEDSDFSDTHASPFRSLHMASIPSSPLRPTSTNSPTKRARRLQSPHWYNCAFEHCSFITEKMSGYEDHLLAEHPEELSFIGYPVKGDDKRIKNVITELCVRKLALYFPLSVNADSKEAILEDVSDAACPILGCEFTAINRNRMEKHLEENHSKVTPRSGLPESRRDNDQKKAEKKPLVKLSPVKNEESIFNSFRSSLASPTLDIPQAPPFKILETIPPMPESEQTKSDGYDSIDEFFND